MAALAALTAEALGQFGNWEIDDCQVDPVFIDEDDPDACTWKGTVTFVPPEFKSDDPMESGDSSYSFDTGGGSRHITHVKSPAHEIESYGENPPDPKGGIGVSADGIEGCDIQVPVFRWSERYILPAAAVDDAYKAILYDLTGKTNGAPFRDCDIGECLFCGAGGSERGDLDWDMTFHFAKSPNETGIMIGEIGGIAKGGWQYLWVKSQRTVSNNVTIVTPIAVYVDQVYEAGDFSGLGIG